ncbi:hypothetical protein GJAV_G00046130 [Gymnothorax javanicus]|nr:hypothetical protein GJAV_G00046130 [Gymnothorax javanicus]
MRSDRVRGAAAAFFVQGPAWRAVVRRRAPPCGPEEGAVGSWHARRRALGGGYCDGSALQSLPPPAVCTSPSTSHTCCSLRCSEEYLRAALLHSVS